MKELINVKVRYKKAAEDGSMKKVSEQYLVEADTYFEAEKKITEEVQPFADDDFAIDCMKRAVFSDTLLSQEEGDDKFFTASVAMITYDEKSGKEKQTKVSVLVQSSDIDNVSGIINKHFSMCDYEIKKINETQIIDIFKN